MAMGRTFPKEIASELPATGSHCAGFRQPIEAALGLQTQVPVAGVLRALESDAEILASLSTREQAVELGLRDPNPDAAVWADTPEG